MKGLINGIFGILIIIIFLIGITIWNNPWILGVIAGIVILYLVYKRKKNEKRIKALLYFNVQDIDSMSGFQFEDLLELVFLALGYKVKNNKRTGDQGADLILKTGNHIIAVQAKRYSSNVGNTAIQEIYTSLNVYGANEGWVVASSGFTSSAKELARKNNVKLFDRKGLLELIEQAHAKILQQK